MAEDCVDHAITLAGLDERPCVTATTHIHGYDQHPEELGTLSVYGTDAMAILELAKENSELAKPLHPELPYIAAEVVWAARHEMCRTVDDALSRRTRALLLNARAAVAIAPAVASLLAKELGKDPAWVETQVAAFRTLAAQYIPQGRKYPPNPTN
jgi:glycerol-3-phosphate dehydrogenase